MSLPVECDVFFDTIVLEIEERLAKVPRAMFAESPVFQDMFSLPPGPGVVVDGSDEHHPLKLEGTKMSAFKAFVRVAATLKLFDSPLPAISWTEAIEAYDLAKKWEMKDLADKLKTNLALSFKDENAGWQLHLAQRMNHAEWFMPALLSIAQRASTLQVDEIEVLGAQFSGSVLEIREAARTEAGATYGVHCSLPTWAIARVYTMVQQLKTSLGLEVQET